MKIVPIFSLCIFLGSASVAMAADQDCQAPAGAGNSEKACACLLTNAYNHAGGRYTKQFLDSAFKNYPAVARANCLNTGGTADRCQWGVDYYDNHAGPNDNPVVVVRANACPSPSDDKIQ